MKQIIPICLLILIIAISYMIYKKREQFTTTTLPLTTATISDPPDISTNLIKNIKNLSDCMLKNGTGWGGLGKESIKNKKLNFNKIINNAKNKAKNKAKNNINIPNTNCDTYRTQIGKDFDNLVKGIQEKEKKEKNDSTTDNNNDDDNDNDNDNEKLNLLIFYWLQQEGYINFTLKDDYSTYFNDYKKKLDDYKNKASYFKTSITNYLGVKKQIIQYIKGDSVTTPDKLATTYLKSISELDDGKIIENPVFLYTIVVYDILSDPLEKCKCMNIG